MINKLFAFFFIAYLLSSCVEDIENYALGNVDNMIPDGKELMELRLVIPGDKQPVARSIENGTAGENRIEQALHGCYGRRRESDRVPTPFHRGRNIEVDS